MIKSLLLKNLQSHKDTLLEFDPGVNIIVGTSDSGKTAILRGLNKVVNNKPSGGLRRHGSKETEIILALEDNSNIARLMTNSRNEYQLNNSEPFKAFGQGVPEEITKLLNIQSVNFQQQMDPPFLLDDTPGEVAQTLNKAVNLDAIDRALGNIAKQSRDTQQEIKTAEAQIVQFGEDLKKFDHLPRLEKDIERLEDLNIRLQEVEEKRTRLDILIDQHKGISSKLAVLSDFLTIQPKVRLLLEKARRSEATAQEQGNLRDIITSIGNLGDKIAKYGQITKAGPEVNRLIRVDKVSSELNKRKESLVYLIDEAQKAEWDIKTWGNFIIRQGKEFDKLMPDVCPLCDETRRKK